MKTVLVVDDEVAIAELLEFALAEAGFAVEVAYDGRLALQRLTDHKPDLVVSDVTMPHLDGVELARKIHATPELRSVPVVLMSAIHSLPQVAMDVHVAFLRKPFDVPTLMGTVEAMIGAPAP